MEVKSGDVKPREHAPVRKAPLEPELSHDLIAETTRTLAHLEPGHLVRSAVDTIGLAALVDASNSVYWRPDVAAVFDDFIKRHINKEGRDTVKPFFDALVGIRHSKLPGPSVLLFLGWLARLEGVDIRDTNKERTSFWSGAVSEEARKRAKASARPADSLLPRDIIEKLTTVILSRDFQDRRLLLARVPFRKLERRIPFYNCDYLPLLRYLLETAALDARIGPLSAKEEGFLAETEFNKNTLVIFETFLALDTFEAPPAEKEQKDAPLPEKNALRQPVKEARGSRGIINAHIANRTGFTPPLMLPRVSVVRTVTLTQRFENARARVTHTRKCFAEPGAVLEFTRWQARASARTLALILGEFIKKDHEIVKNHELFDLMCYREGVANAFDEWRDNKEPAKILLAFLNDRILKPLQSDDTMRAEMVAYLWAVCISATGRYSIWSTHAASLHAPVAAVARRTGEKSLSVIEMGDAFDKWAASLHPEKPKLGHDAAYLAMRAHVAVVKFQHQLTAWLTRLTVDRIFRIPPNATLSREKFEQTVAAEFKVAAARKSYAKELEQIEWLTSCRFFYPTSVGYDGKHHGVTQKRCRPFAHALFEMLRCLQTTHICPDPERLVGFAVNLFDDTRAYYRKSIRPSLVERLNKLCAANLSVSPVVLQRISWYLWTENADAALHCVENARLQHAAVVTDVVLGITALSYAASVLGVASMGLSDEAYRAVLASHIDPMNKRAAAGLRVLSRK